MFAGSADNLVLRVISPETLRELRAETIRHDRHNVLFESDVTPDLVFFPIGSAVVSLVRSTEEGTTVEAGLISSEGITPVQALITEPAPVGSRAMVQVAGEVVQVPLHAAR